MPPLKTKIGPGGRVVIPAAMRQQLSLQVGDEVVVNVDGRGVSIMKPEEAVRHAQELVRRHVPRRSKLSNELIADRRRDAKRER